jgi:phosphate transport system substrate-binding protein
MKFVEKFLILSLVVLIFGCESENKESPTKGRLNAVAADGYLQLSLEEANTFLQLYKETEITITTSSTREAIVDLINGDTPLIITDRILNDEEKQAADTGKLVLRQVLVATDALVVLVHKNNSLQNISLGNMTKIVTGELRRWKDLPGADLRGDIQFVTTGQNSGSYELIQNHLLSTNLKIVPAITAVDQAQIMDYVANHTGAIGIVSAASFHRQPTAADPDVVRTLSFTSIDSTGKNVEYGPHPAYIHLGLYPLHYPVYVIFNVEKSQLAAGFCAFITSAPGQKIILNWGLVPATMPIRLVQLNKEDLP